MRGSVPNRKSAARSRRKDWGPGFAAPANRRVKWISARPTPAAIGRVQDARCNVAVPGEPKNRRALGPQSNEAGVATVPWVLGRSWLSHKRHAARNHGPVRSAACRRVDGQRRASPRRTVADGDPALVVVQEADPSLTRTIWEGPDLGPLSSAVDGM